MDSVKSPVDDKLVNHVEIVRVIPCLADPAKIRFTAKFDRDISSVLPYLNAVLQGAIYNHAGKSLTLRKEGRLITLHPRQVVAAKIGNLEDARTVIGWTLDLVNECYSKRSTINPNFERRGLLGVLDVVKLLPGTNCRRCGQLTCLSFASLLVFQKVSILTCSDIFMAQYQPKRKLLLDLLRAGGYAVPNAFH